MAKKSKRLSAKRVIALITAFLFVLSGMPLSSISAQAAVKKPTIAKSATLKVGTSKTIKISKGSYKIVSVKVSSSKKSVATVKASGKAAIKVTGKKAGKATITTRVKAKKGKTSKTFKLTTKVTVKKATKPEPTVDTSKTVNTQDELVAALADSSITQITIGQEATSITIPAGDYSKVDLIVDAPNASITNNGVFKSITIKAIAANTWIEKAKGNRITSENEGSAHIVLGAGASVAAILVSSDSVGGITIEVTGGSVANLTITGTEKVNLVLSGAASVGTVSVEAASKVDIDATGSSTIEKVEVTEKAAGTATDKTVVNVKAEGSAEIKEITTSAAKSTTNVTANGSADVAKVAVNGSANASIGGTSNKVTEVDIKGASKDAVVTVTTTTVKIEAAAGTDNEKIINNQSGKALTTEVTQSDGTKKETTTATDTTTPSSGGGSTGGESTGGGSGSPAVSVASVTISGQAKVGQTLTATLEPGNATNVSSYQWQWSATEAGTYANIDNQSDATTSSFELKDGDIGHYLRVVVTDTAGNEFTSNAVGPVAQIYTITVATGIENGTIAVDKTTAAAGEKVTVTSTPAAGYGLSAVTVNYSPSGVILVGNTATFTMRAENVTVGAIFVGGEELISLVADKITGLKSSSQIEALTTVSAVESELTAIADAKASFEALTSDQQASVAEVSSVSSKLSTESVTTVGGLFTALSTACNTRKEIIEEVDALATTITLESNVSVLPEASAVKSLLDAEYDSATNGYTVSVSSVAGSALTVAGGNLSATVTITKAGYTRTISDFVIVNPMDEAYAAAKEAIDALSFTDGFSFATNQTEAPNATAVKTLIEADTGITAITDAVVGDVSITEAEIWTVAGGNTTVSFSVSKAGYKKDFTGVTLTNPADDDYTAAAAEYAGLTIAAVAEYQQASAVGEDDTKAALKTALESTYGGWTATVTIIDFRNPEDGSEENLDGNVGHVTYTYTLTKNGFTSPVSDGFTTDLYAVPYNPEP